MMSTNITETAALSEFLGESEFSDHHLSDAAASADDIFSILEALESASDVLKDNVGEESVETSFEFQTSADSAAFQEFRYETVLPEFKRQKKLTSSAGDPEEHRHRATHITVERNRRKQMNHHLSQLRSLMPYFYVKRGDQASIIGGVVDYITELQQVLKSLQAKKRRKAFSEALSPKSKPSTLTTRPPLSPRTPNSPYSHPIIHNLPPSIPSPLDPSPGNSSTNSCINGGVNELVASSKSGVAEVEVKFSGSNLVVNTVSNRIPGQVLKIITALEELALEILGLSIRSVDQTIVNISFTIKIGIECQLSAEELAAQIQQTFAGTPHSLTAS